MGWDNTVKTGMAFERLSPDRLPVPPPPVEVRAVYQTFFTNAAGVTPMGGFLTPAGAIIPFSIPNDLNLDPGDQAEMWVYDATPVNPSEPSGWKLAGLGTVSADGTSIVTNSGVGIDRFCFKCGLMTCTCAGNDEKCDAPNPPEDGDTDGDPVDLFTGTYNTSVTDLFLPGRFPVRIGRSYSPTDLFGFNGPFGGLGPGVILSLGKGWVLSLDITLFQRGNSFRLILPNSSRVDLAGQPDGTFRNMTHPFLQGAVLRTLQNGDRQLRLKDGTTWTFGSRVTLPSGPPLEFLTEKADRNGNKLTIERNGSEITRILDASNRIFNVTTVGGRIAAIQDPIGRTVSYNYDNEGRLSRVTNPEGGTKSYTYDNDSLRLLTITDPRGNQSLEIFYSTSGRVVRQVLADSAEFRLRYQLQGATVTGPNCPGINCPTEDSWENFQAGFSFKGGTSVATTVIDPLGNNRTVRFNNRGYAIERIDGFGQKTILTRGKSNRVVEEIDPLGRRTAFTYDVAGNVTSITDVDGNLKEFEYEGIFNRVIKSRNFLDQTNFLENSFTYDSNNGNLLTSTNPENETTILSYNAFGQQTAVQGPIAGEPPTTFGYDVDGNLVEITDPLGNAILQTFDGGGRMINKTDQLGNITQFRYDKLNRITEFADARQGVTRLTYDENGNLLSVDDAKGQPTLFTYDERDRLISRQDALNQIESYEYDGLGNLKKFIDRKSQATTYNYDFENRREETIYADGSNTVFKYNSAGKLAQIIDSTSGSILLNYDSLDRLAQEITSLGVVSYTYDPLGRRTKTTVNGNSPILYSYDGASRLTQVTQNSQVVVLTYDDFGRRTSLTYPNGIVTSYSYDLASRQTNITNNGPNGTIDTFSYAYDKRGNRIETTRLNGNATELPASVQANYNSGNQQIQFNGISFQYDLNGNLTNDGTSAYTWDARNRLIAINGTSLSATFQYDAFGRRTSKTINGVISQYLYDRKNIIQEISNSTTASSYLRSQNADQPFIRNSQTSEYYHVDVLGTVMKITDQSGAVKVDYTYGPFGKVATSGNSLNSFQFTGREGDTPELYYYRARYYSPVFSRFLSEDPNLVPFTPLSSGICRLTNKTIWNLPIFINASSKVTSSQLFGQYSYVDNNPILFKDPLGLKKCDTTTQAEQCRKDAKDGPYATCAGTEYNGLGSQDCSGNPTKRCMRRGLSRAMANCNKEVSSRSDNPGSLPSSCTTGMNDCIDEDDDLPEYLD